MAARLGGHAVTEIMDSYIYGGQQWLKERLFPLVVFEFADPNQDDL